MIVSKGRSDRRRPALVAVGFAAMLAVAACGADVVQGVAGPATGSSAQSPLVGAVTDAGVLTHLEALQRIADENGGNRAAGGPGYEASADYVVGVLRGAGLDVATPTYAVSDGEESSEGESHEDDSHEEERPRDGGVGAGTSRNIIAQTRTGDPGSVVMIGAHLDSVPEGPGIVDNGSGVASLLEIAARLGAEPDVRNTVRFAFFGHEESGALGAAGYLAGLSPEDRKRIKLYLNVDMVASPNAGYFVQGGKGSDPQSAGPAGSATVGKVLAEQMAATGVTPEIIEFVGDDEGPFIEASIPVGGAENGDAKSKTGAQATAWGGQAGQVYDRCYHLACDRINNVNREVLGRYLRALAGTIGSLAASTDPLR